jgi:hypothetical protein
VSVISVADPLEPGGLYRVIDGMHRLISVQELIEEGVLPKDFKIICTVYRKDTPEDIAVDYATRTNMSQI